MAFLATPSFDRFNARLALPAEELNILLADEYQDTFGFYQNQYGVFSFLQMNEDRKYTIHNLNGSPMIWQPHRSCAWTPTGSLRMGEQTIEPCKAKVNEERCYDEYFASVFRTMLRWDGQGPLSLDANGQAVTNTLARVLAENMNIGARLTMTAGQLYDPANVSFKENTQSNIKTLFETTVGTCQG